jgi:hypothetical protein
MEVALAVVEGTPLILSTLLFSALPSQSLSDLGVLVDLPLLPITRMVTTEPPAPIARSVPT